MIKLNQLRFQYKSLAMQFDLHIPKGQKVAIIGASGAGKSSLLNLMAGFEYAYQGEIWLEGQNHTRTPPYQRPISMLFQENNLFTHLTVQQNIALGLKTHLKLTALEQQQVKDAAYAVGLADFLTQRPTQLSGGQKQRVALARCLLRDKPILLLDEPFSALDPQRRQDMLTLLDKLCQQNHLTLVLVTHQPNELMDNIDRLITIDKGRIIQDELLK